MLKPRDTVRAKICFQDHDIDFDFYCTTTEPWMRDVASKGYFIHEPEVIAAIVNLVKPGNLCVDAGANIGYHSLLMSKLVGDNGRVLAFEPDPNCFDKLKDNLELNGAGNCSPVPIALWEGNIKAADFYLVHKEDRENEFAIGYSSFCKYRNVDLTKISVETVKLDDVVHSDMPAINFLKIDCEGAEEGILHGAEKLLRRGIDAIVCEFNFSIIDNNKIIREYMASLGYDFFYLFESGHLPQCIDVDVIIEPSERRRHFNGMFSKKSFVASNWRHCVATCNG